MRGADQDALGDHERVRCEGAQNQWETARIGSNRHGNIASMFRRLQLLACTDHPLRRGWLTVTDIHSVTGR